MEEVLIRQEAETSEKYGTRPDLIPTEKLINKGVININKPKGPTSHQVSSYVQDILGIKKSGHSGTLDPKVTGVLPIATGKATRIINYLLPSEKEYVCLMHLHQKSEEYEIRKVISSYVGEIEQMPPLKSAVRRRLRKRKIYYIKIHQIKGQDVLFTVGCQAGTYIRKLCHDIGHQLGHGAHMAQLIRSQAGPFKLENSWQLQDLKDAFQYYKEGNDTFLRKIIKPVEFSINLPRIWVLDTTVDNLCHGADLGNPGISMIDRDIKKGDKVAIMTLKDELITAGVANKDSENMLNEKGLAVKTNKVFMETGTYPRISKQS